MAQGSFMPIGRGVGDAAKGEDVHIEKITSDHFEDGRHPDGVCSKGAEHLHFCLGVVVGASNSDVDTLFEVDAEVVGLLHCNVAIGIGVGHVGELLMGFLNGDAAQRVVSKVVDDR